MADHDDNVIPLRSTRVFAEDGSDPQLLDDTQREWVQHTFAGTDIDCTAILTQGQYRQALAYMIQGILQGPHAGEHLLAFAMKTAHMTGEQFARLDGYGPQLCAKALVDMGNGVPGALEKVQRARRILRSGLHPVGPGEH